MRAEATPADPADAAAATDPGRAWQVMYDADCGLCTWAVAVLLAWDRGRVLHPCAIQSPAGERLLGELDAQTRLESWHLVSPGGERTSGGAALGPLLELLPGGAGGARVASAAPALCERAYRLVADHRSTLSKLLPAGAKQRARVRVGRAEAGPGPGRPQ
jgi:predicted DCC family thiol-disulfide oxidoreductase YuxK